MKSDKLKRNAKDICTCNKETKKTLILNFISNTPLKKILFKKHKSFVDNFYFLNSIHYFNIDFRNSLEKKLVIFQKFI